MSVAGKAVQWIVQNRPEVRENKSAARRGNVPPGYAELLRASRPAERLRVKYARTLWQRYGLTVEAFAWLWWEQNGCCALCEGVLLHNGKGYFAVDHDHATSLVRGILCGQCNHRVLPTIERVGVARLEAYLARGRQP
jgi:hypothetical protein